jgi:hypothetical protein
VTPGRFFAYLLRPLLAWLSPAGPLTAEYVGAADGIFRATDRSSETLGSDREHTVGDMVDAQDEPEHFAGDGPGWVAPPTDHPLACVTRHAAFGPRCDQARALR